MLHYYRYFYETYESVCSFPPSSKSYIQKLRKWYDLLRKNFRRTLTFRDILRVAKTAKMCRSIAKDERKKGDNRGYDTKRGATSRGFCSNRGSENWWLGRVQKLSAVFGSGISISRYVARITTPIFIRWTRTFPNFRRQIRRHRIIAVSPGRTMRFFSLPDGRRDWKRAKRI